MKQCNKCNEIKPLADFPLVTIKTNDKYYTYHRNTCKECWRIQEANRWFKKHGTKPELRRF